MTVKVSAGGRPYAVGDEEQRDGHLELVVFEAEVLFHLEQTSVADVDWVDRQVSDCSMLFAVIVVGWTYLDPSCS